MKSSKGIRFFLSLVLGAILLHLFTFDESRLAVVRAEKLLTARGFYNSPSLASCGEISLQNGTKEESLFKRRFVTSSNPPVQEHCTLSVVSAMTEGFWRGNWSFALRVRNDGSDLLVDERVSVSFPKPIALLPLLALIFAILFGLPSPSPFLLCGIYLFLLSGTSIIESLRLFSDGARKVFFGDASLLGTLLILLWSVWHYPSANRAQVVLARGNRARVGRSLSLLAGIWNPTIFAMLGRFSLGTHSRLSKLAGFFWLQSVVAALSLYLFLGAVFRFNENFLRSLYLPRYFSFLLVFAFLFFQWREKKDSLIQSLPNFQAILPLAIVFLSEALLVIFKIETGVPTLVRIGTILCLFEVPGVLKIEISSWLRPYLRMAVTLAIAFLVIPISESTGVFDLAFILVDPATHPNNQVFFTFIASSLIGFLGGSFAFGFFTLGELLISVSPTPLIRAAVLDGCLLGVLVSPFSPWNLLPYVFSRQPFGQLLATRFRTIGFALTGAFVIYSVDILRTVSILRPLMFVFVLMVGFALELRRNGWQIPFGNPQNA